MKNVIRLSFCGALGSLNEPMSYAASIEPNIAQFDHAQHHSGLLSQQFEALLKADDYYQRVHTGVHGEV